MPRKKKSAEDESASSSESTPKKVAAGQPKDKPVKRARAKKSKSAENAPLDPLLAAQSERAVEAPEPAEELRPDAELTAHAADAFEEAFDEPAESRSHVIDPEKVEAVAASDPGKDEAAEEEAEAEEEERSYDFDDDEEGEDVIPGDEEEDEDEDEEEERTERAELPPAKQERLQKILAQAGVASRRHAEELITEGRVQVNGKVVTELGSKADPNRDHIRVDGKLLHGAERLRYFMLNKPKGYVTTVSDPEGRPTVMEFFSKLGERLYPVGRLDYLSEGLLLVTNDGELANKLTRAAAGVEKMYLVKVSGQPSEDALDQLREGVRIEKGKPGEGRVRTSPARVRQVRQGENPWFEVVLTEGRNRELRKMFEEIGHHVEKIRRVGYGPLELDVEPGKMRELEPEEVEALRLAAAGKKLKQRRFRTTDMLPKEAGRSVDHEADDRRRGKSFVRRPTGDRPRSSRTEDRGPAGDRGRAGGRPAGRGGERLGNQRGTASGPGFGGVDRGDRGGQRQERPFGVDRDRGGERRGGFGQRRPAAGAGFIRGDRPQAGGAQGRGERPQSGAGQGRAGQGRVGAQGFGAGQGRAGQGRVGAQGFGAGQRRPGGEGQDRRGNRQGFGGGQREGGYRPRPAAGERGDRGGFATRPPRRLEIEEDRGESRPARPGPAAGGQGGSFRERPQGGDRQRRTGSGFGREGGQRPQGGFGQRRTGGFDQDREGRGRGGIVPRGGQTGTGSTGQGGQSRGFGRPQRDRGDQADAFRPQRREGEFKGSEERPRAARPAGNRGFGARGNAGRSGGARPMGGRPGAGRPGGGRTGGRGGRPGAGGNRPGRGGGRGRG